MPQSERERPVLYPALGRYIAHRRRLLGLTQPELAERVGASQGNIARIEAGKRGVKLKDFGRWADALGVTEAELLREAGAIRDPDAVPRPSDENALDRWWQSLPVRVRQQLRQTADAWLIDPVLEPTSEDEPE